MGLRNMRICRVPSCTAARSGAVRRDARYVLAVAVAHARRRIAGVSCGCVTCAPVECCHALLHAASLFVETRGMCSLSLLHTLVGVLRRATCAPVECCHALLHAASLCVETRSVPWLSLSRTLAGVSYECHAAAQHAHLASAATHGYMQLRCA